MKITVAARAKVSGNVITGNSVTWTGVVANGGIFDSDVTSYHTEEWMPTNFKEKLLRGEDLDAPPDVSSDDGVERTFEQCEEWAAAIGCDVVMATDTTLLLDFDTEQQYTNFRVLFKVFRRAIDDTAYFTEHFSKSGAPQRHVTVTLSRPHSEMVRIAMQAALGSDPWREILSIERSLEQQTNVVIFFEKSKEK